MRLAWASGSSVPRSGSAAEFGGQGMYGMELVDLRDGSSNVSSGSGTAAAYASLGDG
jgi:hypothetical protein